MTREGGTKTQIFQSSNIPLFQTKGCNVVNRRPWNIAESQKSAMPSRQSGK